MAFKVISTKQRADDPMIALVMRNSEARPHWVRFGDGSAVIDLLANTGAKWLSIDTTETRDDGKSSKRTMVTLDEPAVRALRDFCNKVLGEEQAAPDLFLIRD